MRVRIGLTAASCPSDSVVWGESLLPAAKQPQFLISAPAVTGSWQDGLSPIMILAAQVTMDASEPDWVPQHGTEAQW